MSDKFKITKEAMDLLKQQYRLLRVDNEIKGLCHITKLKNVNKDYCNKSKNFIEYDFVGYLDKSSRTIFQKNFEGCLYGAKNKDKVHLDYEFDRNGNEKEVKIPDARHVLMTAAESQKFAKVAKNHIVTISQHLVVDSSSDEIREAIPEGKIEIPADANSAGFTKFLEEKGVTVVDVTE